jgi:hypothetical protein
MVNNLPPGSIKLNVNVHCAPRIHRDTDLRLYVIGRGIVIPVGCLNEADAVVKELKSHKRDYSF